MGRYDKIKVYDGSKFTRPNRIQVYNGSTFIDLGTNDSAIKTSLNVYNGSNMVRATLNKKVIQESQGTYAKGQFKFLPDNGFCVNANTGSSPFLFKGTIYKERDGDLRLFYSGNSQVTSFIEIYWNNNGTIRVSVRSAYGSGTVYSIISSNSVGKGRWVNLEVRQNVGSSKLGIIFDGVYTENNQYTGFLISNAFNLVSSDGVRFKDNLTITGAKYKGGTVSKTVNMSFANGTDGINYANVVHVDDTKEVIIWE